MPQSQTQSQLDAVVVERFRLYLGGDADLPLSSQLVDDLGVESIALVTILMELADELDLDLSALGTQLQSLRTLGDVVSLVETMRKP
jgi:acyl carrier protein